MPGRKVVRVKGLPPVGHEEAEKMLSDFITSVRKSGDGPPFATIVPSCDPNNRNLEALLDMYNEGGNYYQFLLGADGKMLEKKNACLASGDPIQFDASFHGFTQVSNPDPPDQAVADVIAITGLDGHAYGSWATETGMWLRNFLGKDILRFRTMIYGYDTKLKGNTGGNLEHYVEAFLRQLVRVRSSKEIQHRPLFFVAHSFGGILAMRAIIKAASSQSFEDPAVATLYKATYGIILMAVPINGIDFDDMWQDLQKKNHPMAPLLHEIRKDSSTLQALVGDFKNLLGHRKVLTFVEKSMQRSLQLNLEKDEWERTGPLRLDLDYRGSILGLAKPTEIVYPSFSKTHSTIAKLDPFEDEYSLALETLKKWADDAPAKVADEFCT